MAETLQLTLQETPISRHVGKIDSGFVSGQAGVSSAVTATGQKSRLLSLFMAWPNLRESAVRLAKMFTAYYPDEGSLRPLLETAFQNGLDAYDKTRDAGDELAKVRAFQLCLLDAGASALDAWRCIGTDDRGHDRYFDPTMMTMSAWIAQLKIEQLRFHRRDSFTPSAARRHVFRQLLLTRLFTEGDMVALLEVVGAIPSNGETV